jgi:predicted DNA-binding transcriptional regulator YafY
VLNTIDGRHGIRALYVQWCQNVACLTVRIPRMGRDLDERLLGLLKSYEFWTAAALAHELQVSLRTVRRALARLSGAGVQLDTSAGRGGGVRLAASAGLQGLRLEHREVLNLLLSLAVAESLNSPLLLSGLKGLRQKLGMAFPVEQRRTVSALRTRVLVGTPASGHIAATLQTPAASVPPPLQDAFFMQRCVEIGYVDATGHPSLRWIEPQFLLFNLPVWYVLARDLQKNQGRTFRLDRIVSARIGHEVFEMVAAKDLMPEVDAYFRGV